MPITFPVASHPAVPHEEKSGTPSLSATTSLKRLAPNASSGLSELLQTSLTPSDLPRLIESKNGFVDTCMRAYNTHQNLVLRPDDVWIAIMCQFSSYVEANAEGMRTYFVAHEGKKELTVRRLGSRYSVDWAGVGEEFARLLEENVKDPELREWIVPAFSTTTKTDEIVGAVVMMATLKSYFSYGLCILCGIPSVTLLGTREDWLQLQTRLQKFRTFGTPEQHPHLHDWCSLLTPLLTNFVDAFTAFSPLTPNPTRQAEICDFFGRVCHREFGGSGPTYISGWLMFFCAFDKHGKWQLNRGNTGRYYELPAAFDDAVWIPRLDTKNIPNAYVEVDVTINDNGQELQSAMVAGLAGYKVLGEERDTVQPHPAWWIFTKEEGTQGMQTGFEDIFGGWE